MANYSNLKTAIENAVDWNNGDNEITGQNLLDILETIIDSLGAKYKFADVATPASSITTPDEPLFYLAGEGTYTNFSGLSVTIPRGTLAIFYYDTAWHYTTVRTDSDAFFNVNQYLGTPSTTYTKANGRNAVPSALRSKGMIITYLTTNGWIIEQNLSTSGTWNADANWQTIGPVSVSQNTLSIGDNYAGELSTTYDVTLHNSGATFASLEALLSDANIDTLIPLAVRKDGMSIKFVQTSDNKYVQYRLMSASFNTTVANWEKYASVEDVAQLGQRVSVISSAVLPSISCEAGGIDMDGKENDITFRARTTEYITGPFELKMKTGFAVYFADKFEMGIDGQVTKIERIQPAQPSSIFSIDDNQYVYRLVFCRWDGTTLDNSYNFVTSGTDIIESFTNIIKDIEDTIINIDSSNIKVPMLLDSVQEGKYITGVGNISSASSTNVLVYDVHNIDKLFVNTSRPSGSVATLYAFYSSNAFSSSTIVKKSSGDSYNGLLQVPNGAQYIALTVFTNLPIRCDVYKFQRLDATLSADIKKNVAFYDGEHLYYSTKQEDGDDLQFVFCHCLANSIYHLSTIATYHNTESFPKIHTISNNAIGADKILYSQDTDLISPVNINGYGFIGGNHLYNGNKTAHTTSYSIYDEHAQNLKIGELLYSESLTVHVNNELFVDEDNILINEEVRYKIDGSNILIDCALKFKTELTIVAYYGLCNYLRGDSQKIISPNGPYTSFVNTPTFDQYAWSSYPQLRSTLRKSDMGYIYAGIFPCHLGIGISGYLHQDNKDYFYLMSNRNVSTGEITKWSGIISVNSVIEETSDYVAFSTLDENSKERLISIISQSYNGSMVKPSYIDENPRILGNVNEIKIDSTSISFQTEAATTFIVDKARDEESAMMLNCSDYRLKDVVKSIVINNFDANRVYLVKRLLWNRHTQAFVLELKDTHSNITRYRLSASIANKTYGKTLIEGDGIKAVMDLTPFYECAINIVNDGYDVNEYGVNIQYDSNIQIFANDFSQTLKYNSFDARLLDCGVKTKKFYLSFSYVYSGNHVRVLTADTLDNINNINDLQVLFNFDDYPQVRYVRSLKELENGNILVCVNSGTEVNGNYRGIYSEYYIYNPSTNTLTKKFEGNWNYAEFDGAQCKNIEDAFMTVYWDFSQFGNTIVVSERAPQGDSGKVWYSKDGGDTWYLIFNAYPRLNGGVYPIRMPSGFDNTDPSHPDFDRPVPGTSGYPDKGNFHVHGVCYDHYRNQIVVVSGDATNVHNSYTAIWVLKNPDTLGLYPETTVDEMTIAEGGTNDNTVPKMLNCSWSRVGLHVQDSGNQVGYSMQFVNCVAIKEYLLFGCDCYPCGIYAMSNPETPSLWNLRQIYSLDVPEETALTHCAAQYFKIPSSPHLFLFHREGTGWNPSTSKNDAKAYILASNDGVNWQTAWEDDTLDSERNTEIGWGFQIIGKTEEMYFRPKGVLIEHNKIRQIRIK